MIVKPAKQKHYPREQLDQKISDGNRRAAVGAFAAKIQPRDERHIQKPGNGITAVRTVRWRPDDILPARHPVNAHVQKTSDDTAEHKKDQRPELHRHRGPDFGIKDARHIKRAPGWPMTNDEAQMTKEV